MLNEFMTSMLLIGVFAPVGLGLGALLIRFLSGKPEIDLPASRPVSRREYW